MILCHFVLFRKCFCRKHPSPNTLQGIIWFLFVFLQSPCKINNILKEQKPNMLLRQQFKNYNPTLPPPNPKVVVCVSTISRCFVLYTDGLKKLKNWYFRGGHISSKLHWVLKEDWKFLAKGPKIIFRNFEYFNIFRNYKTWKNFANLLGFINNH